jgi:hypothetical protein
MWKGRLEKAGNLARLGNRCRKTNRCPQRHATCACWSCPPCPACQARRARRARQGRRLPTTLHDPHTRRRGFGTPHASAQACGTLAPRVGALTFTGPCTSCRCVQVHWLCAATARHARSAASSRTRSRNCSRFVCNYFFLQGITLLRRVSFCAPTLGPRLGHFQRIACARSLL